jgi:hypothetical protein
MGSECADRAEVGFCGCGEDGRVRRDLREGKEGGRGREMWREGKDIRIEGND